MHETHIPQLHLLVEVCHHLVSKCLEFGHLLPALGLVKTVVGGPSIGRHLLFQAANLAAKFAYGNFWSTHINLGCLFSVQKFYILTNNRLIL